MKTPIKTNDYKTIGIYTAAIVGAVFLGDAALADGGALLTKSRDFLESTNSLLTDTGRPFLTLLIGLVTAVVIGIYRSNLWEAIFGAIAAGGIANLLPDLFL